MLCVIQCELFLSDYHLVHLRYLTAHEADSNLWHCKLTQMFGHVLTLTLSLKQS